MLEGVRQEPAIGTEAVVLGTEAVTGAEPKSPLFHQLYDEEEGGKLKRIKVEICNLKVRFLGLWSSR